MLSLSGFGIKVMVALKNEFGSVPSSEFFEKVLDGSALDLL